MKKDGTVTGLACLGLLVAFPLTVIISSIMNGWALSTMWGWFVVPLFHLPELNIPYAIGISMVVGMLVRQASQENKKEKSWSTIVAEIFAYAIFTPLFTVFLGWIVKGFLG